MKTAGIADVARRRAWLVIAPAVVAAIVALTLSLLSTPHYRASAEVLVGGPGLVIANELQIAAASALRSEVRVVVGDEPGLSVDVAGDSDVLRFTATSANAANAATAANLYADTYAATRVDDLDVIDRAGTPANPFEPQPFRSAVLAFMAGLLIGIVAAVIATWRDPIIRTEQQLAKLTGTPNLAVIPRPPLAARRPDGLATLRDPNSAEAEAYRTLRTAYDFVTKDAAPRVLLVTSPRPGEGKSTVAADFAASMARGGRRVVLVDGDLRKPQLHRLLGVGLEPGLSSVLADSAELQAAAGRVEEEHNLRLLPAGPPPPDPAELLASDELGTAIQAMADAADLVVIDTPPVVPVADPLILAQHAGGALLVATAGVSDRREWAEMMRRLAVVETNVIGTVLLRPDARIDAAPQYRYPPSARPKNWWVTAASVDEPAADVAAPATVDQDVDPLPEVDDGDDTDDIVADESARAGKPVVNLPFVEHDNNLSAVDGSVGAVEADEAVETDGHGDVAPDDAAGGLPGGSIDI